MDMRARHDYAALHNVRIGHSEKTAIERAGKAAIQRCRKNGWIIDDFLHRRLMLTNDGERAYQRLAQQYTDQVKIRKARNPL